MGTLNDAILRTTGGPTVNDGLRHYYNAQGVPYGALPDMERAFLRVQMPTEEGTTNDLWMKYLSGTLGFEGTLNDMLLQYWRDGGSGGFSPISLDPSAWYDPSDLNTMFQNVEGSSPVTASGQPVGLLLDKSEGLGLGPEIAVNGSFDSPSNWTLSPNVSISGGKLAWSGAVTNSNAQQPIPATSGEYCEVTIDVASVTQGAVGFQFDAGSGADIQITAPGVYTFRRFQRSIYSTFYVICYGTTTAVVNSVSVKAVRGSHISQETAGKRPLYQSDGTLHWLLNDGVDDYLMGTLIDEQSPPNEYWLAAAHITGEGIIDGLFRRAPDPNSVGSSSNVSGIFQRSDIVERLYNQVRTAAGTQNSVELNSAYVIGGPAYVARAKVGVSPNEMAIDSGGTPVTAAATYEVPDGFATNILYNGSVTAQVKVFEGVIFNRTLTTGEAEELRLWMNAKAGI